MNHVQVKPESPFHDMLETELISVDRESKGIQWPLQDDLMQDDDLLNVDNEKKVRQKFVVFFLFCTILYLVVRSNCYVDCILIFSWPIFSGSSP